MTADFTEKDQPLRDDVGRLGAVVGDMLREQEGDDFFLLVERTRQASVAARDGASGLDAAIAGVPAAQREKLVRAFSAYFDAVNMGEQIHRLRRRRDYERNGPQPNGPEAVLKELKEQGISADDAAAVFANVLIEPVFTAHPTEAVRRTLLTKQQRIARALVDRIEPGKSTPKEEARAWTRIAAEIGAAWQTEEHFRERPKLRDEVEHVLFYLRMVIYRIVPSFLEAWESAFKENYGRMPELGSLVRFGTWVGGDMDGNPNVGAATIRATLVRQRDAILELYRLETTGLIEYLSQSESRAGFSDSLKALVSKRAAEFPKAIDRIPDRHRDMPYRVLLYCMVEKLKHTFRNDSTRYRSPEEFAGDLRGIAESLHANHGDHAGLHHVRRLLRRIECFGFHFATLDTRQDSEVHRRVCGTLLDDETFSDRDAAARATALRSAWKHSPAMHDDEEANETLAVFHALKDMRREYGEQAVGPYIISMAQGADDVLAVLYLARHGGMLDGSQVPLDVAPLFETVVDLQAARATLESMLNDTLYREHLKARGDVQYVMLGYSDSGKDSGIASARWALYRAQEELVAAADAAGIKLVLFHGRGGTVSRGGTKVTEAIPAQPPGSVRARLRVTEQGEIIHARYGLRGIAQRTLEATTAAVLKFSLREDSTPPASSLQRAIMETIAVASRTAYRALVYDDPRLFEYFQLGTPVDVITRMRIGSRPASRRQQRGIGDLRAIPWVFAWTQSRLVLPGWYGVSQGLQTAIEAHGLESVRAAASEWPVLRTLLGDVEMVMAKADLGIASRYAELAGEAGKGLFSELREAFEQTRKLVCEVRGATGLLEREPWLARAIGLRNPYIDPMSLLQIEMLKEWRAGNREDSVLEAELFTTVKGIARGLMNTG
ncbi:MAG: phosphoenolpyruvate carboxylase [Planctomycetes bacterium]|nr:phosphoenolpyruvate carboxylase [Planctomycetota bacterium]